jgi:hypothetical protein
MNLVEFQFQKEKSQQPRNKPPNSPERYGPSRLLFHRISAGDPPIKRDDEVVSNRSTRRAIPACRGTRAAASRILITHFLASHSLRL